MRIHKVPSTPPICSCTHHIYIHVYMHTHNIHRCSITDLPVRASPDSLQTWKKAPLRSAMPVRIHVCKKVLRLLRHFLYMCVRVCMCIYVCICVCIWHLPEASALCMIHTRASLTLMSVHVQTWACSFTNTQWTTQWIESVNACWYIGCLCCRYELEAHTPIPLIVRAQSLHETTCKRLCEWLSVLAHIHACSEQECSFPLRNANFTGSMRTSTDVVHVPT
jgi:hypothetical protein